MYFAARTFAMKMGQALSMLIYTSITAAAVAIVEAHSDAKGAVTITDEIYQQIQGPYRTAAIVATAACLLGAFLFLMYNEKDIMGRIRSLKGEEA